MDLSGGGDPKSIQAITINWWWDRRAGSYQIDVMPAEDPQWLLTNQRLWLRSRPGGPVALLDPSDVKEIVPVYGEEGSYVLFMCAGTQGAISGWAAPPPTAAMLRHGVTRGGKAPRWP